MVAPRPGDLLEERGSYLSAFKDAPRGILVIDRREDGRAGKKSVQNLEHPLGPAVLVQIIVDKSNLQKLIACS